jgi:hypothetical protein
VIRLRGKTWFLLLSRDSENTHHSIAICEDFDTSVNAWTDGTRVSPIFPLKGTTSATPPHLQDGERAVLHFLGPLFPGDLPELPCEYSFLTLGLYNLVFLSLSGRERRAVRQLATLRPSPWEEWHLTGAVIKRVRVSPRQAYHRPRRPTALRIPDELQTRDSVREYRCLIQSSRARASAGSSFFLRTLDRFDVRFRELVLSPRVDLSNRHRLLVNANAALSRQSSQTYAGTSPILETECHYWTHSLLGIGIASLALLKIRAFLDSQVRRANIIDRLLALARSNAFTGRLEHLRANDNFWSQDFLKADQHGDPPEAIPESEVMPLVTCFSGRDGFRSTDVSLSLPLETISSCNTPVWTLLTMTHEYSHNIVGAILGKLLPSTLEDSDEVFAMHKSGVFPNLFQQIRGLVCFGIWRFSPEGGSPIQNGEHLLSLIAANLHPASEILTHCFDFLYFYEGDVNAYIRSVWASWGVIPNIQMRIRDYVLRCLSAIHTQNIGRSPSGAALSMDQLLTALRSVASVLGSSPYLVDAISLLENERGHLEEELGKRELLVKLSQYVLYSPTVARLLEGAPSPTSGTRIVGQRVLEFSPEHIDPPLVFAAEFSRDTAANAARSLWLLTQIAFRADTE